MGINHVLPLIVTDSYLTFAVVNLFIVSKKERFMGEFSKKIGEHGEKLVNEFFSLIGWDGVLSGSTVVCFQSIKHQLKKDSIRTTHGIDFFHSTRSQLQDFTLDNVVCSVKYTTKAYPKNANSKFKEHLKDLAQTVECYMRSDVRSSAIDDCNLSGVRRANDVGVLFWLTNYKESDQDVVSKVANIVVDKELSFSEIYIVDNSRAAFLFEAITCVNSSFPDDNVYFHYSFSSANYVDNQLTRYGKVLPVEYLASDLIPFRLINKQNNKTTFCIVSREGFSTEVINRLLNLASDVSQEFTNDFVFLFPDYDELNHANIISSAKRTLSSEKRNLNIIVNSFNADFRGLANG
jgi:hypothetical protein